jgi:hypothetical protein
MSYCRNPYYIYPSADNVVFTGIGDNPFASVEIPNVQINVLIYEMLTKFRREELIDRLKDGRNSIIDKFAIDFDGNIKDHTNDKFLKYERQWQLEQEDELIKSLLNV